MPSFDAQNTDRENSRPVPASRARDNDVKTVSQRSAQDIARDDYRNQQQDTGKGTHEYAK